MLSWSLIQFKPILPYYELEGLKFMLIFTHVTIQIQLERKMEAGDFINIFQKRTSKDLS